jgi:hypothetical protein
MWFLASLSDNTHTHTPALHRTQDSPSVVFLHTVRLVDSTLWHVFSELAQATTPRTIGGENIVSSLPPKTLTSYYFQWRITLHFCPPGLLRGDGFPHEHTSGRRPQRFRTRASAHFGPHIRSPFPRLTFFSSSSGLWQGDDHLLKSTASRFLPNIGGRSGNSGRGVGGHGRVREPARQETEQNHEDHRYLERALEMV